MTTSRYPSTAPLPSSPSGRAIAWPSPSPADAFDGSAHRLDVTDASTGRTHRAAYRLPARDASYELTYAGTLPGPADQAAKGMLVSAGDALYFADRDGGFLYRTARPWLR